MSPGVRYPQGNVLLRNLSKELPVIDRGEGIYLFDTSGKRYVDASSGALVVSVGHGSRKVADAIHAQLTKVGYVNGTQFTSQVTETLATRLATLAAGELPGAGLKRAAFLSSGSEAVEAALKFARQLWVERGQHQRSRFIARTPGYHGNTLYALSASGRPHYKKLYGPMLSPVVTVSAPYPYRSGLADYETQGADHYGRELEETIQREGPDTIAAFIAEPVIGSSAGAAVPPKGYFERIRQICDRHGILLIADEVLCGTGRCGTFFASKAVGLRPDIVVMGKGLGGGCTALSAVLVREEHLDEMKAGSGYFQHAQTYLQAPFLTAAGVAVLDELDRLKLVENAARTGARFLKRLREKLLPLRYVGCVQGLGLLAGVELVADKTSRAPFERSRKVIERLVAHFFERGIIVWPNVGHAGGVDGDLFMLGPPLIITETEADALCDSLFQAMEEFVP
jgi:adenosylmethionine-8-amino-7-oxononanoate aminotransferase